MNGSEPLDNPRWEAYCRKRAEGLTQRQAMLAAYPSRAKWKPNTVDKEACKLEGDPKVSSRLRHLKDEAARSSILSRAQVLSGMSETFSELAANIAFATENGRFDRTAVTGIAALGRTLMDSLPEEVPDVPEVPARDFGLLIAPPFLAVHRAVCGDGSASFWLPGGRASGKSSDVSLEIVDGVVRHPDRSAVVFMKNGVDIRGSVWEQVLWAISALDYTELFEERPSMRRIVLKSTGQAIVFRGCDRPDKTKAIKAPGGTYFAYQWWEECDLFHGYSEIRTTEQSVTRGAPSPDSPFYRFRTFNPPRSRDSWANRRTDQLLADGSETVIRSTYLDMPPEWIPEQVRADAEQLKVEDPAAYEHEWLGAATGIGGEVFDLERRVTFREVTDAEIASFERPFAGQDFGWWPDPWAFTISEWDGGSRTLTTWYEDGGNKLTPDASAERIRRALTWSDDAGNPDAAYLHNIPVSSDDAAPEQIAAQRAAGINARAAGKGNMRIASYRWLASVNWVIDPVRCPVLAEEVRSKLHERTRDGEWLEEIEDGDDHAIDATRYAVMPLVRRFRQAYPATSGAR